MANPVVFYCPVQVYKFDNGSQQQVAAQAMAALLRQPNKQYIIQCYSQQREIYCALVLTAQNPLHITLAADGCYASFYDQAQINWSLRFRNATDCVSFAANVVASCHLISGAGLPSVIALNSLSGEVIGPNDTANVKYFKCTLDIADFATLGPISGPTDAAIGTAGLADIPRSIIESTPVGRILLALLPGSCVVVELTGKQTPVYAAPAPAPTAPVLATPAQAPAFQQPASVGADAMVQALLMSQIQQQPLQFAALHKKLEQIGDKFDKFDLNAQFGAFQKIITEFNEHNRTFWEKHNRREKEFMELETALCKERGEHQILRQEHTIAQRELRIQTEMKVQNAAKKNKWKAKCRQLEQDKKQLGGDIENAKNAEIEELKKQVQEERALRKQTEAEHAQELKYAEEDAAQRAKAQLIAANPTSFGLSSDASSSIEALMEVKQKLAKLEEEHQVARKDHMEEVVALQDKLVQEKENSKELQKKCTAHAKRVEELMGELREKEMEVDQLKEAQSKEIQQLKERLYQIGEGQLSMQLELAKQELKHKQKEIDELKEQVDEKKAKESGAVDAVSRQRDRLTDELREYQRAQLQHDEELHKLQMQLMKEKEANMSLSDRYSKVQTELQVLLREKHDRELLEGGDDSKPGAPVEDSGALIKSIMSDVYYEISEQIEDDVSYPGERVLSLLLKAIKEQTLKAIT
eukprot:TRINITY_DN20995_c0_g1_i1.p1 TRINITY_DN20995_c0_g1~~TRINITY_DN20995_c0_g1_i1.p1  ORF type:complete len:696 (+),score=176.46 TRINITY_DN20995_c0_g1_i1:21-2108(+)